MSTARYFYDKLLILAGIFGTEPSVGQSDLHLSGFYIRLKTAGFIFLQNGEARPRERAWPETAKFPQRCLFSCLPKTDQTIRSVGKNQSNFPPCRSHGYFVMEIIIMFERTSGDNVDAYCILIIWPRAFLWLYLCTWRKSLEERSKEKDYRIWNHKDVLFAVTSWPDRLCPEQIP